MMPALKGGRVSRRTVRRSVVRSLVTLFAFIGAARADEASEQWKKIEPCFSPPPEHAGKPGDYRSPLLFDDGSPVKTPADWQRRRAEILNHWHKVMGPWPPLIERPKVETLESHRRENFTQHKVGVEIAK